jgi:regulator of sigma E protease
MSFLIAVAAFAVAIGILVVVHEYGHYSVARLCGVKVLRFSIGFGHPLLRHVSKKTGTEWTLAALPLGGYVKMLDEREADVQIAPEDLPHAFNRQSVFKRFAIVLAGPVANFLLAIVLFGGIYAAGVSEPVAVLGAPASGTLAAKAGLLGGETVVGLRDADDGSVSEPIRSFSDLHWKLLDAAFDKRRVVLDTENPATAGNPLAAGNDLGSVNASPRQHSQVTLDLGALPTTQIDDDLMSNLGLEPNSGAARIVTIEPGSPAEAAGLKAGDTVLSVDGHPVSGVRALISLIQSAPARVVTLDLQRDGHRQIVKLTPQTVRDDVSGRQVGRIGAALGGELKTVTVRYGPIESLTRGVRRTWDISAFSVRMFGRMLSGQASLKNLSGPVTIADYAGKSARLGLSAFVSFLALVSISLGVLNLMPIPVLDGGHLLYYLVEAVTGRAVSERWQGILQRAGLVCILALSVLALFNDLTRLIHL